MDFIMVTSAIDEKKVIVPNNVVDSVEEAEDGSIINYTDISSSLGVTESIRDVFRMLGGYSHDGDLVKVTELSGKSRLIKYYDVEGVTDNGGFRVIKMGEDEEISVIETVDELQEIL